MSEPLEGSRILGGAICAFASYREVVAVLRELGLVAGGRSCGEERAGGGVEVVSATSGEGIEILEDTILEKLGVSHAAGLTPFSARARHVRCLQSAAEALQIGVERFEHNQAGELLAEDLRSVHDQLGEITGTFGADDLLGEIFSSFCIGK